jgi:hypothetical protein
MENNNQKKSETPTAKNSGNWHDETRGIIESNGELDPALTRYRLNVALTISPDALMTAQDLRRIVDYCQSIADSYRANREYIRG